MRPAAGFASHRGLVRQTNEDSFLVRRGLYVVCDGMGGARGGEVASQMACQQLVAVSPETASIDDLRAAIVNANDNIAARSVAEPHLLGMGTTLTSALIRDSTMVLGHVGDSRAYLLHDGTLRQLTDDHSWVGEMVRRGELTAAEAAIHPHRSVITKALGTEGETEPDLFEIELAPGDRLLLCSDGLSGMVADENIAEILRAAESPQAAAENLVKAALTGGGEDNVTVVVVDLLPDEQPEEGGEPAGNGAENDAVIMGPEDRGEERSAVPGFIRPALARGARLTRRPPLWARQNQDSPKEAEDSRPGRWSRRRWIVTVLCVVVVLALIIAAFAVFNSNVYYVGTENGMVALYQGLPTTLLGIRLSSVIEVGTIRYDSLPQYQRERVDAHDLVGKEEGQAFMRGLATLQ